MNRSDAPQYVIIWTVANDRAELYKMTLFFFYVRIQFFCRIYIRFVFFNKKYGIQIAIIHQSFQAELLILSKIAHCLRCGKMNNIEMEKWTREMVVEWCTV